VMRWDSRWLVTIFWLWWRTLYRESPFIVRKRWSHWLVPTFSRFVSSGFFFWGFVKEIVYSEKHKMWMSCMTEQSAELQNATPIKCLSVHGEKLDIVLMCVVPLMVPILRSTEHIRNFVRSSVWKCINLSSTYYGWRYIMLCFIAA
jgi:hypothetical protein